MGWGIAFAGLFIGLGIECGLKAIAEALRYHRSLATKETKHPNPPTKD